MGSVSFIPIDVSRQMRSREKPLWIGRPIPLKFAMVEGGPSVLNGLLLLGFAGYVAYDAYRFGETPYLMVALTFAAIGLYLICRPIVEYLRAKRTTYVITNQRLIILDGLWRPTMDSFAPSEIGSLAVRSGADGIGTIIFHERRDWLAHSGRFYKKIGFKAVADVKEAVKLIRELKGQAQPENPARGAVRTVMERYRGYEIVKAGESYRVGGDSFADPAAARAHIDANWARSGQ
jgi:hypothetical protein